MFTVHFKVKASYVLIIYIEPFNKVFYFIKTLKSRRGIILPQSKRRGLKFFLIKLVALEKCLKLGFGFLSCRNGYIPGKWSPKKS